MLRPPHRGSRGLLRVREARQLLLSRRNGRDDEAAGRVRISTGRLSLEEIVAKGDAKPVETLSNGRLNSSVVAKRLSLVEELRQLTKRLGALDRYERTALARRKGSIRAFEAMRPAGVETVQLVADLESGSQTNPAVTDLQKPA